MSQQIHAAQKAAPGSQRGPPGPPGPHGGLPGPHRGPPENFPIITPNDIVIAVMGVTGAGKSTFISLLVDGEIAIGHTLTSCTDKVGIYSCMFQGRRVFLIDTPGFDDTHRSDTDVLTDVACFLSTWYQNRILLTGIIYLHRITDLRMAGSALKNLSMFQKLCGEHYFNNVVLATTMWGNLQGEGLSMATGEERERELVQNPRFWGAMYQRGSRIMRHMGNRESAWGIISYLASLHSRVLNIQDEMVNQGKKVSDTAAGKEVERDLQAAKEQYKRDIAELHKNHEDALKNRDEELAKVIEDEKKRCEEVLRKANEDTEKLQADFGKLKKDKDDQYQKLLKIHNEQKAKNEKALMECQQRLEASEKRNKEEVEKIRAEYQALLEQQQQIRESETSGSGLLAMLVGLGLTGFSALTLNPFGVAGGVALYSAGAERMSAKEAAAQGRVLRQD